MITEEEISKLERGDIVRYANGETYIVINNYKGRVLAIREITVSGRVLAIREITVSNPIEWTIVKQHNWDDTEDI